MLADYPGTVLVVSHDRDFLDRVATAVIVAEGQGVWTEYAGGYTDMVAQRGFGVRGPNAAAGKILGQAAGHGRHRGAGRGKAEDDVQGQARARDPAQGDRVA